MNTQSLCREYIGDGIRRGVKRKKSSRFVKILNLGSTQRGVLKYLLRGSVVRGSVMSIRLSQGQTSRYGSRCLSFRRLVIVVLVELDTL